MRMVRWGPQQRFQEVVMRIDYSPFFRSTVGFDRLIGLLESASEQGYPPYNIERSDENNYRVTLAVAGFADKELSVDVKGPRVDHYWQARRRGAAAPGHVPPAPGH